MNANYISKYSKLFFDGILKDTSLSINPLYVTGGTSRRLFLLENNHPMTVSDVVGIFQSDIDVHASTYSMHSGSFMNSIFGLTEFQFLAILGTLPYFICIM